MLLTLSVDAQPTSLPVHSACMGGEGGTRSELGLRFRSGGIAEVREFERLRQAMRKKKRKLFDGEQPEADAELSEREKERFCFFTCL